ncbi:B3 domain-containing protein At1g05920-like [Dendrobium catenatum]|uniref:B3 domain-containing protein At1g05920-like n=1 Tax=Dendrobium catenatum TaxID=906689 RepID=UPI0009F3C961|nr:B3 domain-containing protein At1g05920-like [Dendrobium catenatum]
MELPPWTQRVANDYHAVGLTFLTVKTLDSTDVSEEHARIRIPELLANDMLRIYLPLKERAIVDSTEEDGPIGMLNDGLNVLVFVPGMRFELKLTSWDVCDIVTNIKGSDWPRCVEYLKLKAGDKVAIWIFRSQENSDKKDMPCFIFHKL